MNKMKSVIVIPARYGSTRLPGKPLRKIAGQTLLSRVVRVAKTAGERVGADVIVATDHESIVSHATELGARSIFTSPELRSGTDRVYVAINELGLNADFVVNLQGDAPFTPPDYIEALVKAASTSKAEVVTIANRLSWTDLEELKKVKEKTPFSGTCCVIGRDSYAYWFSKNIIPAMRDKTLSRYGRNLSPVYQHVGLYGYSPSALAKFVYLPEGYYEKIEGLEQLRFIENGTPIYVQVLDASSGHSFGIDSEEDIVRAEQRISAEGEPNV